MDDRPSDSEAPAPGPSKSGAPGGVDLGFETVTAEEKPRLWAIMLEQWPYYDEYQAKTDREIPLVVLSPR